MSKTASSLFLSDGEDETHNFAVQMQPQYHHAIVDMILHYDWRSVIYIYQSSEGLYRLQKIYENIPKVNLTFLNVFTILNFAFGKQSKNFMKLFLEKRYYSLTSMSFPVSIVLQCFNSISSFK